MIRKILKVNKYHERKKPMNYFTSIVKPGGWLVFVAIILMHINVSVKAQEKKIIEVYIDRDNLELQEFPFLGRLLTTESPWECSRRALVRKVFDRMPTIAQGDKEYPLLFSDRREENGWPGEKIFDQYAYESEYYTFDREYPVIKLHIGRPLLFDVQHGRVEALARAKNLTLRFPQLDPEVIPPFLQKLDSIVDLLAPNGARRLPGDFLPLITLFVAQWHPNDSDQFNRFNQWDSVCRN